MRDFLDKVAALRRERQTFATAVVVGRRAPVSAHLGDRAIVHDDGRMEGFVGGACAREIIRRQALESIRAGRARLVSIRPEAGVESSSDPEHVFVPMTCVSEGAVDVYVEPNVRPRRLVVVGATPVAEALARTAVAADYDVVRVVERQEQADLAAEAATGGWMLGSLESLADLVSNGGPATAAIVATQGHYDEEALEIILRSGVASYVGLVASRKRGGVIKSSLEQSGVSASDVIRVPAGLDLGARTAPEVAISILAEIVQSRPDRALEADSGGERPATTMQATAIDPVCHMEVEIATARHSAEIRGTRYYFCCAQCRTSFEKEPDRYLASLS